MQKRLSSDISLSESQPPDLISESLRGEGQWARGKGQWAREVRGERQWAREVRGWGWGERFRYTTHRAEYTHSLQLRPFGYCDDS